MRHKAVKRFRLIGHKLNMKTAFGVYAFNALLYDVKLVLLYLSVAVI